MPRLAGVLRRMTSALVARWLLFVAVFSLAAVPPVDPDLWWHLANGRLIAATGSVPRLDVYSFSASGQPWVVHEWLADLAMFGLHQLGGLPLLVGLFAGVVTVGAICLYSLLRGTGLNPTVALLVTLAGALSGSTAWGARPQLLNLLFSGVLVVGLVSYGRRRWAPLVLAPGIWLWANVHSGFLVGVIISLLYLAGEAFDAWRTARLAESRPWIIRLAAGIAAGVALSLVNPSGIQTILFPLGTLTSPLIQNNIQEWASPDFHSLPGLLFEAIVFITLGGLATGKVRPRSYEWLWAFALLFLALASQRNVPLFVIGAAPLVGRCAQALLVALASILPADTGRPAAQAAIRWSPAQPGPPTLTLALINLVLLLVVGAGMIVYRALPSLRATDEAAAIAAVSPVQAAGALHALGKPVRVFNYYDYGGYLVWQLYPDGSRVFIDGRVEVYGPQVFSRYLRVSYLADGWQDVIAEDRPDAIVMPTAHPITGLLSRDPTWQRIDRDRVATVFIRVGFAP
jgi:hypothetical protein